MKSANTWILIANGARARILEHKSAASGIKPMKGMEYSNETLSSSEIMADKPGRAFATTGNARSAMQPRTDPVAKRELDFMRMVAEILNDAYSDKSFDRLVIFAAHKAMGDLRPALNEGVLKAIIAEIPKDLTKVPNDEIAKHLEDVMLV